MQAHECCQEAAEDHAGAASSFVRSASTEPPAAGRPAGTLLVVLLGLPGAGKTSLATLLVGAAAQHHVQAHHLCLDDLLQQQQQQQQQVPSADAPGNDCHPTSDSAAFSAQQWQACRLQLLQQVEMLLQHPTELSEHCAQHTQPAGQVAHQQLQNQHCCQQQQQQQGRQREGLPQVLETAEPPPQCLTVQQQQHGSLKPAASASAQQKGAQHSVGCCCSSHVGRQQQQQQQLVLVDDNNYYHSMRYQFFQMARARQAAFLQVYLDCPLDLALERNRQRQGSARVPDSVLTRCADAFEAPDPSSRPWEAGRTWTLQPADVPHTDEQQLIEGTTGGPAALCRLWGQLVQRWGPPVPPLPDAAEAAALKAAATAANLASRIHQADLASRAMLCAALEHVRQDVKPQLARRLNEARKQLLQQLRQQRAGHSAPEGSITVDELAAAFQAFCMSQAADAATVVPLLD